MDTEKEIVLVLDNSGVLNSYVEDILSPLDFGIYSNHNLTVQEKMLPLTEVCMQMMYLLLQRIV